MIKKETFKKIMCVVFGNEPHDVQGEILREIFVALKDVEEYERNGIYNILIDVLDDRDEKSPNIEVELSK